MEFATVAVEKSKDSGSILDNTVRPVWRNLDREVVILKPKPMIEKEAGIVKLDRNSNRILMKLKR